MWARICPRCNRDNTADARFCNSCGAPLPRPDNEKACPICGKPNPMDARYCGSCRAAMSPSAPAGPDVPAVPDVHQPSVRTDSESDALHIWDNLPTDTTTLKSGRPVGFTIAGLLLFVVATLSIISGIYALAVESALDPIAVEGLGSVDLSGYVMCCGTLTLIFGAAALAGGYFTLVQERWTIALMGAILGMLSVGPYALGFLLGLIALILIAAGKDQFNS